MSEGACHFYVYYAIDPDRGDLAASAVDALFARTQAATGIAGRLRRRADDPALWMEIYEGVDDRDRFAAALTRLRESTPLAACLASGQTFHVECFQDFTP